MLRDLLRPEHSKAGRKHIGTLMARMGIQAPHRKPNASRRQRNACGPGSAVFLDDALLRTGPRAVEKSGDLSTARPFTHQPHRALFVLYKIAERQNRTINRSADCNLQDSTWHTGLPVQTSGTTSIGARSGGGEHTEAQ